MDKIKEFANKHSFILLIVAIVLLIVIILTWIYFTWCVGHIYDATLEGLWMANDNFCAKSDVDGMLLFVGPRNGFFDSRNAYIIIYANDKIVLNEKLVMSLSAWPASDYVEKKVSFSGTDIEKIWPAGMKMKLDVGAGHMILESDDTVYAELYKDTISSNSGLDFADNGSDSENIAD
jgi:hypothetical protein